MFSRRTQHEATLNVISSAVRARRALGLPICDLTQSNPTETNLPYDSERILRALGQPASMSYEPHAFGLPSARAAVSAWQQSLGFAVPLDQIVLTSSTSEAYAYLFKVLADPGDEVLIPRPSYPLFEHLAALESVRAVHYTLDYDGAWHVDFDSIERALTERTRAIVLVTPNNPTGSFLKRDELARLCGFGLPLISDEVFGAYALGEDPRRARSVLETTAVPVFALGGLSKFAALPQLKLAWLCAAGPELALNEALRRLELVADTFLSPGAPVQHALPEILAASGVVREALNARIGRNFARLSEVFRSSAAAPLFLEGGWYATLRLPAVQSESDWVLALLNEDGVLTQPGWFYDFVAGSALVLSLITDERQFALGVASIAERVRIVSSR